MCETIFTSKSKDPHVKFNYAIYEQGVKQVITEKRLGREIPLENPDPNVFKTFVVATGTCAAGTPVLMRSYNKFPSIAAFHATVWQAA